MISNGSLSFLWVSLLSSSLLTELFRAKALTLIQNVATLENEEVTFDVFFVNKHVSN